jgi:hypothetical protein
MQQSQDASRFGGQKWQPANKPADFIDEHHHHQGDQQKAVMSREYWSIWMQPRR